MPGNAPSIPPTKLLPHGSHSRSDLAVNSQQVATKHHSRLSTTICALMSLVLGTLLVIRAIILLLAIRHELERTAQETVQPEEIQALQRGQQGKGDDIGDPAFILLGLPVKFVGADGAELG